MDSRTTEGRREESRSDEQDSRASSADACNEASLGAITQLLNELKRSVEGRLDSIEARLSTGITAQRAAEDRLDEALCAAVSRIRGLEGLLSRAEGDGVEGSSRWVSVRVPAVNTAEELAKVRGKFVRSVSKVVLGQLLDDILEDGVLNDEEKDSILEENRTTADKARSLIDMVKKKGDLASTKMIARLCSRDPMLSCELGLLSGQPALPAAETQMKQEWSTTLICTTEAFWKEKGNDIDIYPVTKKSFGSRVALLITNLRFNYYLPTRHGAEVDEENMDKLLRALGYEVVKYTNLTEQEIDTAMIEFSKHPKLKQTDSVLVVIMTHGDLGFVYGVDSKVFPIDRIYKCLGPENCPVLLNKPKIIIIQACRGSEYGSVIVNDGGNSAVLCDDVGQPGPIENDAVRCVHKEKGITSLLSRTPEEGGSAVVSDGPSPPTGEQDIKDDTVRCVHKEKDFISLLSSTPDTVSYRNTKRGSYFILHVVEVFNTFAHKDDIEELFRKVMRRFEDLSIMNRRQMPTKERCTLTKRFYFFPGL
ncbi:caspase-1-A-like [Symphorus nematophorus]